MLLKKISSIKKAMGEKIEEHRVVIAGAGPAGSTASIFLSKAGISHVLLEKETFPRDKICGDALSGKVLPILRKIDPDLPGIIEKDSTNFTGSYGIRFAAPNGKFIDIPFDKSKDYTKTPPGYISKRLIFDHYLFKLTSGPLCDARQGHTLTGIERVDGKLNIEINGAGRTYKIRTPLLISAEGDRSVTARKLSDYKMQPKHYCAGIRGYYNGVTDMHQNNFIELHFIKEMLPGYLWIFPLPNGMANVGAGMLSSKIKKQKVNLKARMLDAIKNNPTINYRFKNATLSGPIKGWGLPLGSQRRKISGNNFLLTGDAASMIDPFTGEGISNAMYCGMKSAEVVERALLKSDFSQEFLSQYDNEVYHRLWDELKLSKKLQDLSAAPWLFNFVVNRAKTNETLQDVISCMFDDLELRTRLRNPAFYFKLLFNL
jgi:geranylgeranyl reductase family protein